MKAPGFDVPAIAAEMIAAARTALTARASGMKTIGEMELRRLAGTLAEIGSLAAKGEIEEEKARHLLNLHQLTVRSVLRSAEGLSLLAAEQAVQAAMRVGDAVLQQVTGFRLLPTTEAPGTSTPAFKAGKDL